MKRLINLALSLLAVITFTACSDSESEYQGEYITIGETEVSVAWDDTFYSISVTSKAAWTAAIDNAASTAWLRLVSGSGVGGSEKHSDNTLGRIWNESQYPEDATQAYMRLFCNGSYDVVKKELFEYAQRCVTYDFDAIRQYVGTAYDGYSTKLLSVGDGCYQVTYGNCPSSTGFNVIPLEVPAAGSVVTVDLKGLTAGSKLADGDAGEQVNGDDQVVGTTTKYYNVARGKEGWTYGFVALKSDGTRVYGDIKLLAQAFVMDASKLSSYTIKPMLVYTKGGKQYKATITLNMKY